jgi:hypothetical protein
LHNGPKEKFGIQFERLPLGIMQTGHLRRLHAGTIHITTPEPNSFSASLERPMNDDSFEEVRHLVIVDSEFNSTKKKRIR